MRKLLVQGVDLQIEHQGAHPRDKKSCFSATSTTYSNYRGLSPLEAADPRPLGLTIY